MLLIMIIIRFVDLNLFAFLIKRKQKSEKRETERTPAGMDWNFQQKAQIDIKALCSAYCACFSQM